MKMFDRASSLVLGFMDRGNVEVVGGIKRDLEGERESDLIEKFQDVLVMHGR